MSHGILGKFFHLASAQTIRDVLHTIFFIYLARVNPSHYGEFQLAFQTAMIVLFLGEFGLNQPLVSALSKKYGHKGDILVLVHPDQGHASWWWAGWGCGCSPYSSATPAGSPT